MKNHPKVFLVIIGGPVWNQTTGTGIFKYTPMTNFALISMP